MTAQDENLKQDPYNSSLYKMAVLSPTPIIYVQKYVDRRVIPIYIHSSGDDKNEDDEVRFQYASITKVVFLYDEELLFVYILSKYFFLFTF